MGDLSALLRPASIAIVGATDDTRQIRGRMLHYLNQRGYTGELYLISSTRDEIGGRQTYKSIRDVPAPIDLVLIAIRADGIESVVRDCLAAQVKFAICYSSGFAEEGPEGRARQDSLAALLKGGELRFLGPNSAGLFNVADNIPATFTRNVDADRPAIPSHRSDNGMAAIVAQSGGLAFAIHDRCVSDHGLHIHSVIATGNEVDLDVLDAIAHLIEDPRVKVVLLLIESIGRTGRLAPVALRARELGKPIVVSKFGRGESGTRAAVSHAARLTGSDASYDAVFRRLGMIRIDDEDEMSDLAAAFVCCKLPAGKRVGILTTSGGAGIWVADACEAAGLSVPLLDAETQAAIADVLPSFGSTSNPVDMTAQVSVNPSGGGESVLVQAIGHLAASPSVDAVVLAANFSDGALLAREADGLAALAARIDKPLVLYSHASPSRASLDLAQQLGFVCFASTRRLARALRHMADYANAQPQATQAVIEPGVALWSAAQLAAGICEYEAKSTLRAHGVGLPPDKLARTADEAVAAAASLGYPVVLKIQSPQILHKTEVGGVALGLKDEAEVRAAFDRMNDRALAAEPSAVIHGVLVQSMLPLGRELALGIVRDPDFGLMMMVGLGGIHIEILKDVVIEQLPIDERIARSMLQRLRAWPLLAGVRGELPADVDAVVALMAGLSRLMEQGGETVGEIDLNPVFVYRAGDGLAIVDAAVIGRAEEENR